MLRKKVFLYVSFVKSVQFVCAIIGEPQGDERKVQPDERADFCDER